MTEGLQGKGIEDLQRIIIDIDISGDQIGREGRMAGRAERLVYAGSKEQKCENMSFVIFPSLRRDAI